MELDQVRMLLILRIIFRNYQRVDWERPGRISLSKAELRIPIQDRWAGETIDKVHAYIPVSHSKNHIVLVLGSEYYSVSHLPLQDGTHSVDIAKSDW